MVSDKSSSFTENISAETNENVNENVMDDVNETVNLNVNKNTGFQQEPIRYNFAGALKTILSQKYCLINCPFMRKDNVQIVIRTASTIDDGCGRWVNLKC